MGIVGACCAEVEVDPPPSLSSFPPSSVNLVPVCPTIAFQIPFPGCTASGPIPVWGQNREAKGIIWTENGVLDAVCYIGLTLPTVFAGRNADNTYMVKFTYDGTTQTGERIRNDKQLKIYFQTKKYDGPFSIGSGAPLPPIAVPAYEQGWRSYLDRAYPWRLYVTDGVNTIDLYWRLDYSRGPGACPILRMYRAEGSFDVSSGCQNYFLFGLSSYARCQPIVKEEDLPSQLRYRATQTTTFSGGCSNASNIGCKAPADPIQCSYKADFDGSVAEWIINRTSAQFFDGVTLVASYSTIDFPISAGNWEPSPLTGGKGANFNFSPYNNGIGNGVGNSGYTGSHRVGIRHTITPYPCAGAFNHEFVGTFRHRRTATTDRIPDIIGGSLNVPATTYSQTNPIGPPNPCGFVGCSPIGWLCDPVGLLAAQPTPVPNEIAGCNSYSTGPFVTDPTACWQDSALTSFPPKTWRTREYTPDCRRFGNTSTNSFGGGPNNGVFGCNFLVEPL